MVYVREISYAVLELSVSFSNRISRTKLNKAVSPTLSLLKNPKPNQNQKPQNEFLNVKQLLLHCGQERRLVHHFRDQIMRIQFSSFSVKTPKGSDLEAVQVNQALLKSVDLLLFKPEPA